jgi:hypothetical protein
MYCNKHRYSDSLSLAGISYQFLSAVTILVYLSPFFSTCFIDIEPYTTKLSSSLSSYRRCHILVENFRINEKGT